MDARPFVLVAQGENKAHAVTALVEGPVTALVPGSVSAMVTPNTDSPRIPHDKVTKVMDFGHQALSGGHHHPRAESFKSSLSHSCEISL